MNEILFAVALFFFSAGSVFAGDRHYDRHGNYDHRVYERGGHHHGHDFVLGAIIGGVITGAVINAQRQQGYYQPACWMESRPLYDGRGQYVTHQWVQVCAQP